MNYLAHGYRFLDDPLFVAGTAVPDWLRVAAPRVRARARVVKATIEDSEDGPYQRFCRGILRHHADDDVFHASTAFQNIYENLARQFRKQMPDRYDHRPGLLGHIVTELLLDNEMARRDSTLLPRYYHALKSVDSDWVQASVNSIVYKPVNQLSEFIDVFREIKFLYDYADNDRLLWRLNQVIGRAGLSVLDPDVFPVFDHGRQMMTGQADALLESCQVV
jgi:hypothetical protein